MTVWDQFLGKICVVLRGSTKVNKNFHTKPRIDTHFQLKKRKIRSGIKANDKTIPYPTKEINGARH